MTRLALLLALAAGCTHTDRFLNGDTGKQAPRLKSNGHHAHLHASRSLRRSPLRNLWTQVARCESGNRWHINTGNGYYGGLQTAQQTWDDFGGRQFAARPDLATRAEQTIVAERILALQGPTAWPVCGRGVL